MKVDVAWQGNVCFSVQTGSGHVFLVDGPPEHGGENKGFRPMEAMLASAATCSAFDVVHILKKGRRPATQVAVSAEGTRAQTDPKVFTQIVLHFSVGGVPAPFAERAVKLSVEKYCSALRMLAASCQIDYTLTLLDR